MKDLYEKLEERVQVNERKQEADKQEHDRQIDELMKNLQHYREEIERYKEVFSKKLDGLQEALEQLRKEQERLEKQQQEHAAAIKDIPSLREKIRQLSEQVDQLIRQGRLDHDRLNALGQRLNDLKNELDGVASQLIPIDRILAIEKDIQDIRFSLGDLKRIGPLETNRAQLHSQPLRTEERLQQYKNETDDLRAFCAALSQRIDSIQIPDLTPLYSSLDDIRQTLLQHNERLRDLETKKPQLSTTVEQPDHMLGETQNQIKVLEGRLERLENQLNNLPKPELDTKSLQTQLAELIGPIRELMDRMRQIFAEGIQRTTDSIETLRRAIEEVLRKKEDSPNVPIVVDSQPKRGLVREPLPPRDLLDDVWSTY